MPLATAVLQTLSGTRTSAFALVVATFVLELVIVPLYLWQRNLWPLGVLHGWLGGLFYLWVENRDLWVERLG